MFNEFRYRYLLSRVLNRPKMVAVLPGKAQRERLFRHCLLTEFLADPRREHQPTAPRERLLLWLPFYSGGLISLITGGKAALIVYGIRMSVSELSASEGWLEEAMAAFEQSNSEADEIRRAFTDQRYERARLSDDDFFQESVPDRVKHH